jgi:predicted transcriptional regulator
MSSWIIDKEPKRRDKLCIIAEILEIAKGGTLKTQIMYRANLSFAQLNDYLKFMFKLKLLEKIDDEGKDVYVATEKGLDFLQRQNEVQQLVKLTDEEVPNSGNELLAKVPINKRDKK